MPLTSQRTLPAKASVASHTSPSPPPPTNSLLRDFTTKGSDFAFRELVSEYVNLVYSTALRRLDGDAHRAEDVVQTVFTDLARKAHSLPANVMLGGWLHHHCCYVASNLRRAESRRIAREQEALAMQTIHPHEQTEPALASELDDAIEQLDSEDRNAILLRFFQRKDFRAIGLALGATENAAQKRVTRALDKLRDLLSQRGVTIAATALATALADQSIQAAPATLAARASESALAFAPEPFDLFPRVLISHPIAFGSAAILCLVAIISLTGAHQPALPPSLKFQPVTPRAPAGAFVPIASDPPAQFQTAETPSANAIADNRLAESHAISSTLQLVIVAADSGQPIPNVTLSYSAINGATRIRKDLTASRLGLCVVPLADTSELELISRVEGFADTRLKWQTKRGDVIPDRYTLRLQRGVKVGGKIVNERGELISGATVNLSLSEFADRSDAIGSHEFHFFLFTSEDGTWQSERVAESVVHRLSAVASHPDYVGDGGIPAQADPAAIKQLLAGTHIIRLEDGAVVQGVVVNENGDPIPNAKVLAGGLFQSGKREGATAADGRFSIKGAIPKQTPLTASAKGYATATIMTSPPHPESGYRITLKPGYVLKLRVLNKRGDAIPGATAVITASPFQSNDEPAPQMDNWLKADAQGRIRWTDSPLTNLSFEVIAQGYFSLPVSNMPADGEERVVTLNSGIKISGTVRDAATGHTIPRFTVVAGYPSEPVGPSKTKPTIFWSPIERHHLTGMNGQFEQIWDEPIASGLTENRYIFKVEAEGYKPAITRVVLGTEPSAVLEVALESGGASQP